MQRAKLWVIVGFIALAVPAAAQSPQQSGGPIAIGQAELQKSDSNDGVVLVQAPTPPPPPASGGVIQLAAFGWLEPYVDTLVQLGITGFFAWLGHSAVGSYLDKGSRDALETFVKNRASSLIADGAVKLQNKSIDVHSALLAKAAAESSTAIPGALKRFGLTPENVAQKIIDAIPQTPAGAQMVAQMHNAPGDPTPVIDRPPTVPT
jgi:hypothetical protein